MPAKGEFEITYFGGPDNPAPCGGVNYSAPYTAIPPTDLAPGSVNTQNINGFLCASPVVASPPFDTSPFASDEYVLGSFQYPQVASVGGPGVPQAVSNYYSCLVVTNLAIYIYETFNNPIGVPLPPAPLFRQYSWVSSDLNQSFMFPGQAVSFVAVNGNVYFTGLMLNGIYIIPFTTGSSSPYQATDYVCGRWIAELAGRLVVGECIFPTGGGTGIAPAPTIAWSGVGIFGQAWDGNPAHDVWNAANQAYFSGNIGGFNLLGDVPDQITGIGTVGQSIILLRTNGLTQQDPNSTFSSSGLQPFNWYHMWSSPQGVGALPGTVSQYGQILTFRSSDNVYSLSLSSGLNPVGNKIMPKILSDERAANLLPSLYFALPGGTDFIWVSSWYFSSIYNLDGQLHYLLTFSSYATDTSSTPNQVNTNCYAYDLNMGDGSWGFWDFSKYYGQSSAGATFVGFSCPAFQGTLAYITGGLLGSPSVLKSFIPYITFGCFTSYGTIAAPSLAGTLLSLVPLDYDFISNPITPYVALLYAPKALPSANIVFRGETVSLGHDITVRSIRIQADNAPLFASVTTTSSSVTVVPGVGSTPTLGHFTVASSAGFNIGDNVTVAGNSNPLLDGTFSVYAIGGPTEISLIMLGLAGDTGTGGTLTDVNVTGVQQQAQVILTGMKANSVQTSPTINMQGNAAPVGQPIYTYYGSAVLTDQMIQPSITSVFSTTAAWQTLCAFRIASVSLIGNDTQGSRQ